MQRKTTFSAMAFAFELKNQDAKNTFVKRLQKRRNCLWHRSFHADGPISMRFFLLTASFLSVIYIGSAVLEYQLFSKIIINCMHYN